MQIIRLIYNRDNFYSPATGEIIANKVTGINGEAVSLIGYWNEDALNKPFIKNTIMQASWESMIIENALAIEAGENEYSDFIYRVLQFLKDYISTEWVVFELVSGNPDSDEVLKKIWCVIDLGID
jgi:hypothetical protein